MNVRRVTYSSTSKSPVAHGGSADSDGAVSLEPKAVCEAISNKNITEFRKCSTPNAVKAYARSAEDGPGGEPKESSHHWKVTL